MLKKKRLNHLFVDSIPTTLQEGVIYVCVKHNIVSHLCACGCGHRIDTPLDPSEWKLIYDGEAISLYPSIGNWDLPCRTHYFISGDMIIPVPPAKKKKKKGSGFRLASVIVTASFLFVKVLYRLTKRIAQSYVKPEDLGQVFTTA